MRRLKRVQIVTPSVLLLLVFGFLQSESAPLLVPGPGLVATVVGARVSDAGIVSVRFTLTDAGGIPLTPTASAVSSTSDPRLARVRFTIARLEVDRQTAGGSTVEVIANRLTSDANSCVSKRSIRTTSAPARSPNSRL